VDLKDIKAIIDLMKKNSVSEFELEKQDFKIRLKRGGNGAVASTSYEETAVLNYIQPAGGAALPLPPATPVIAELEIKSPMIGTFYRSPSPEAAPYIEVGAEVNPETVVCIIEAMKLFNEIESEIKGKIVKILVEDASPVEYDQPLFLVEP